MCSLFGLIDYQNTLTTRQKNHILQVLSKECEARGTDATGIAYNFEGSIKVYKRPLAAHKLKFHVPRGSCRHGTYPACHTRQTGRQLQQSPLVNRFLCLGA